MSFTATLRSSGAATVQHIVVGDDDFNVVVHDGGIIATRSRLGGPESLLLRARRTGGLVEAQVSVDGIPADERVAALGGLRAAVDLATSMFDGSERIVEDDGSPRRRLPRDMVEPLLARIDSLLTDGR